MDFLFPDEDGFKKMAAEYAKIRNTNNEYIYAALRNNDCAAAACFDGSLPSFWSSKASTLLLLYFTFVLGYNLGHGNAIYDADGGLGGVCTGQGQPGNLDNFF